MLGKSRFRSCGPSATDLSSKVSFNVDRESGQDFRPGDDGTTSGRSSVRNISSIESENSNLLKRPISSQQKMSTPQKRDLKRTTSLIPRAAPQRSKTPSGETSNGARKSETSLKSKDGFITDSSSTKGKKNVSIKSMRTGQTMQTDGIAVTDKSKRPESQRNIVVAGKGSDQSPLDQSKSRTGSKTVRKVSDGRNTDKPEGKAAQKATDSLSSDGSLTLTKNLESQYSAKKNAYGHLIKEFREKQKTIREHYKMLEELRKKIQAHAGKEIQPEETFKIHEIIPAIAVSAEPPKKESDMNCKRMITTFDSKIFNDMKMDFTDFYNTFESQLSQIHDLWVNAMMTVVNNRKEGGKNSEEDKFELDGRNIFSIIEKVKYQAKVKVDNITEALKKLYQNREKLKQELKVVMDGEILNNVVSKELKDMTVRLTELDEQLEKEKIRTEDLMEKRNALEEKNVANSEKIQKLEQTVIEQRDQLEQLSFQCKNLRKKELMANRGMNSITAKDLKAKSELLKALENRITELTNDYNAEKKGFQARIEELEQCINEKEEALKSEKEVRKSLELSLADAEDRIRSVREKKKVFADMVDKTKQIIQSTNSGSTKRDEQLWTELEATKIVVKGYQDQISKVTQEKNKMLLKFQTISEDKSNKNAERLAAEIVRKDDIINCLKDQVTQLQLACEEHNTKYNKLLAQVKEVHEKVDGKADVATLSKQLGDVKMQKKELQEVVKELVTHNEELEAALVQRSLELDQRDRLVKQQCNLLKMRDELTDLVRSKDDSQYDGVKKAMEQSTKWEKKAEKIFKDLEKKANELDDMYKTLVDKQKQVEKLTKLVKTMEDQQDRAQEQRVRFETKINDLQRQLIEGKGKSPKTPLFGN